MQEFGPNGRSIIYAREPHGSLIARVDLNQPRVYFHYFDALGSTVLVANNLGQVTDRYDYGAWGETYHLEGTTADNPYQYVGELGYYTHWQAPELANMLHLGVRFYEPEVGRFSQMDPIRDGLNWYAYVEERPVLSVDPTGTVSTENILKGACAIWCKIVYDATVSICNKYTSLKGGACVAEALLAYGECVALCAEGVDCVLEERWSIILDLQGRSNLGFGICRKQWWESNQGNHKVCTRCWDGRGQETFGPSPYTMGYCGAYNASYCYNSTIDCYSY